MIVGTAKYNGMGRKEVEGKAQLEMGNLGICKYQMTLNAKFEVKVKNFEW